MAQEETSTFQTRHRITASIILDSPCHIGSGETEARALGGEEKNQVATVVTDYKHKPYIPGSTLRGCFREQIKRTQNYAKELKEIFGTGRKDEECGGKLRIANAYFCCDKSTAPDNLHVLNDKIKDCQGLPSKDADISDYKRRYWDEKRWCWTVNGVAIDRFTGSAAEHRLFFYEVVVPGTVFNLELEGIGLNKTEIELIFSLLSSLKKENSLILGKGQATGLGKCHIHDISIHGINTKAELDKWLQNGHAGLNFLTEISAEYNSNSFSLPKNHCTFAITLNFDGPLLINDPSSTYINDNKDSGGLSHIYLGDSDNKIMIPGTSFKGAFRSQMEKILRTMADNIDGQVLPPKDIKKFACYPSADKGLCCGDIDHEEDVQKLCFACRLCGGRGYRSPLQVSDFTVAEGKDGNLRLQDFVAIDRFTGGVAGDKKFNALHREEPKLSGTITLDLERIDEPLLGLFFLTLRDLLEGDIAFGYGKTKGFGHCTAEITAVRLPEKDTDNQIATFLKYLPQDNQFFENKKWPEAIIDMVSSKKPSPWRNKMTFHYPYHFVPVISTDNNQSLQTNSSSTGNISDGRKLGFAELGTACHDRYHANCHSGTLTCTLETKSATIIGGQHEQKIKTEPTTIHPFEINGEPAIPASTLKGCIASLAEAASNSALRVLENKTYSRRATTHEALSAVGLIIKINGELRLLPLALPTLKKKGQDKKNFQVPSKYQTMFHHNPPRLKIYCYNRNSIRTAPESYSRNNQKTYRITPQGEYSYKDGLVTRKTKGKEKTISSRGKEHTYLLGYSSVSKPHKTKGKEKVILRTFYSGSRHKEIPGNKKFELALPFPEDITNEKTYEILPDALAKFTRLAKERDTENNRRQSKKNNKQDMLPFTLKGSSDFIDRKPQYTIQEHDIVFFEPDKSGQKVQEISISQIWRKEIDNKDTQKPATTHQFFSLIDSELLPMNPKRKKLSPAELLFGFVEEPEGEQPPKDMRALLGRVRFSAAKACKSPADEYYLDLKGKDQLTLNILASPKPPSPAVYFQKKTLSNNIQNSNNKLCYISKNELKIDSTKQYIPLGRKQYLHHNKFTPKQSSNNNLKLKSRVTPLNPGCKFQFKVRFDNLTDKELGLLIYSISPTNKFQHKIGMGKPLGFGSVDIQIEKVKLIARQQRYSSDGLKKSRVFNLYSNDTEENTKALKKFLNEQKSCFASLHDSPSKQRNALELIGCNPCTDVKYGPGDQEDRTYQWFSNNDRSRNDKQGLIPLDRFVTSSNSSGKSPLPVFRSN